MWQAQYFVKIPQPKNHYVHVTCHLTPQKMPEEVEIFLPCWSPGSYLIREYAKHLRSLKVTNHLGEELIVEVKSKSAWTIFPQRDRFVKDNEYLVIHYEVYCHELSVRTSYIDSDHAFLQGPSYLIGFNAEGSELVAPSIEFEIPKEWSKISTSLPPDESVSREIFRYQAKNFDHLWDCPVQLGCHITDGFVCNNKQYALALWGSEFPHLHNLKTDIKKITSIANDYWVS